MTETIYQYNHVTVESVVAVIHLVVSCSCDVPEHREDTD